MAISFALYEDALLTIPVTGNLLFQVAEDGSSGWVVRQVYFGSTLTDRKVQVDSNPGVGTIQFTLVDAGGSAWATTDGGVSSDNLTYFTPTLDTGLTEILSGTGGVNQPYTFYIRAQVFSGATPGNYTDLQVITQTLREVAV